MPQGRQLRSSNIYADRATIAQRYADRAEQFRLKDAREAVAKRQIAEAAARRRRERRRGRPCEPLTGGRRGRSQSDSNRPTVSECPVERRKRLKCGCRSTDSKLLDISSARGLKMLPQ